MLCCSALNAFTQSTSWNCLSSLGGNQVSGHILISHTVGQPSIVGLSKGSSVSISQGFQFKLNKKGFGDEILDYNFYAFPNPANSFVNIDFSSVGELFSDNQISIITHDIHGRIVNLRLLSKKGALGTFDLSDALSGIYLVSVYGNNQKLGSLRICKAN
jgi:hypothetical protein